MREAAFAESHRSCMKPLTITIPSLFQRFPPTPPLSFFRLIFHSLSAMCKCDSVFNIGGIQMHAVESREASRIYVMCTIIISDNYLVFLEPHALSVLKARTELYARRDVRSILSHMVRSYQLLLNCPTRDVAIVTPLPIPIHLLDALYIPPFFFNNDERSELLF